MRMASLTVLLGWFTLLVYSNAFVAAEQKPPTVLIATLVRNKAHTLPYFLSAIEGLNYPKSRISIWFQSDHNEDTSEEILDTWISSVQNQYHSVEWKRDESPEAEKRRANESTIFSWPEERFRAMMKMKGAALRYGRDIWTDYVLLLDADVFLTHADTLQLLISQNVSVVAPMLQSDGLYSNYWCGMTERFYYQRTDEYKQILDSEKVGTFPVPMVHSAIFIDLNDEASDQLTYDIDSLAEYSGPVDDIIVFAMSANYSGTTLYVSNVDMFGYMMSPLEEGDSLEKDVQQLTNLKVMHINRYSRPMPVVDALSNFVSLPPKDRMTLSKIFMINLWRREERRDKMLMNFDALGLDVQHFPAVDGKQMDEEYLKKMNIQFLPGYEDPYSKRPMTMGEIGCALSHYFIWEKIVEEGLEEVLVLEDDIRFEPYFKQRLEVIMDEVRMDREWDLVYVGRKRLLESSEPWVDGTNYLVRPSYSYWTLGYLISLKGAKKLLAERPLQRLVPVDEYLPIMFDKHTNENWKKEFPNRNLNAFSVAPLLLFPTHYTGDQGYISDTENSEQIPAESGHQPPPQFGNNNSEIVGRIPKNNDKEQVTEDRRDTPAKMNLKENVKHEL